MVMEGSDYMKMVIDFGNIVEEMKNRELNICFLHNKWLSIIDKFGNLYQMELFWVGICLDKLIQNRLIIDFKKCNKLDVSEMWKHRLWSYKDVQCFIDSQSECWK